MITEICVHVWKITKYWKQSDIERLFVIDGLYKQWFIAHQSMSASINDDVFLNDLD